MRYAVLSDIHANLPALHAVLDHVHREKIDRILCLGDILGYGASPQECLDLIEKENALVICGNHEAGCVGRLDLGWFNHAGRTALEWTRDRLGFVELNTLRRLLLSDIEGPFTLVHASLRHPEKFTYITDIARATDCLAVCRTPVCLVGHTHAPLLVEYDPRRRELGRVMRDESIRDVRISLDDNSTLRTLINPGSVGQPRDDDPRASFAIIDTSLATASVIRVEYDIASAQRSIREAGLPAILADRLSMGR